VRRRQPGAGHAVDHLQRGHHPRTGFADPIRIAALVHCLAAAPERYRVVLELQQTHNTTAEIAVLMRILPGSVYKIVERAKAWLRNCIIGRLS
jgi:DNA-directed RNA polymerase specialized sigma24 family protein